MKTPVSAGRPAYFGIIIVLTTKKKKKEKTWTGSKISRYTNSIEAEKRDEKNAGIFLVDTR